MEYVTSGMEMCTIGTTGYTVGLRNYIIVAQSP
jgi:hypothetical protein